MKNLKKVLALVMVFAMMATAMFSAAAFTDSADIEANEAVDVLSALGVINGYEDGSFQPNGTVTRAEMAAMIYIIRNNGNTNADNYANLPTSFTDLGQAPWAAGYIKHAQMMNIISGRSDKIFDPNAPVTGVEAALMCLRSAGYDVEKAGIGGATWAAKTLSLANEAGLLDDVQADLNAALPRQWAAQMMYNLLDTDTVVWSNDSETFEKTDRGGRAYGTVGSKYMYLDTYEGILKASGKYDAMDATGVAADKIVIDQKVLNKEDAVQSNVALKCTTDYSALVGEYVKVMYDRNDKIAYGVTSVSDENFVVLSDMGKVGAVSAGATKVKVYGTEYDLDVSATASGTVYGLANDTFASVFTGAKNANQVKFVSNDGDEKIDLAIVIPVNAYKVTYVGSDSITLQALNGATALGNVKTKDCIITGTLAKDDYVAVVDNDYNYEGKHEISKIDVLEGKTEQIKVSGAATTDVKVDGTWYKMRSGLKDTDGAEVAVDSTYKFVVIDGYVYNAELVTGGATKMAMVTGTTNNTDFDGNVQVRLLLSDGTSVTAYAKEAADGRNSGENKGLGQVGVDELVAYEVSNEIYTLYIPGKTYTSANDTNKAKAGYDNIYGINNTTGEVNGAAFAKTETNTTRTIAGQKLNDNAVVFVKQAKNTTSSDFEYKVLTGSAINAWNTSSWGTKGAGLSKNSGLGYLDVAVLIGAERTATPGATTNYAYVTSDVSKGSDYVAYTIWDGKSESSVDVIEKVSNSDATRGAVISFDWDGDGVIKNVAVAGKFAAIEYTNGKQVKLNEEGSAPAYGYTLADDVVVLNVNTTNKAGISGNAITEAQKDAAGKYYINAKYVLNSDNEIELLVIDVQDNKWNGKDTPEV